MKAQHLNVASGSKQRMGHYKAVVFDYDGTLIDTFEALFKAELTFEEIKKHPQLQTRQGFKKLFDCSTFEYVRSYGWEVLHLKQIMKKYRKAMEHINWDDINVYQDIPLLLDEIKSSKFIITTNFAQVAKNQLRHFNLDHHFEDILGLEIHRRKDIKLRQLMQKYKLQAKDIIFISDTSRDIREAKRAGVTTVAVTWGYGNKRRLQKAKPDHVCKTPIQILPLLHK